MDWLLVLPLVAFLALAVAFGLLLRRASRVIADTREWDSFRRGVVDVGQKSDVALAVDRDGHRRRPATAAHPGVARRRDRPDDRDPRPGTRCRSRLCSRPRRCRSSRPGSSRSSSAPAVRSRWSSTAGRSSSTSAADRGSSRPIPRSSAGTSTCSTRERRSQSTRHRCRLTPTTLRKSRFFAGREHDERPSNHTI